MVGDAVPCITGRDSTHGVRSPGVSHQLLMLDVLGHRAVCCWLGTGWNFVKINPLPKTSIILEGQSLPQRVRLLKHKWTGCGIGCLGCSVDGRLCDVDTYALTDLPKNAGVPRIQRAIGLSKRMSFLSGSVLTRRKPTIWNQFIRASTHLGSKTTRQSKSN